ncbi:hypothetical protein FTUN_3368 [Frigoriglobus tundricola]|uniref:Uncharacterized protein n=1 Tax=Frigoriglobus tundricola TaxID=2774151 RepID=A0A6M5YQQ0_9BACT|nr:hypothetical protein FTUN_3368 [Frigoriglobus tundricola]
MRRASVKHEWPVSHWPLVFLYGSKSMTRIVACDAARGETVSVAVHR